MVFKSSEKIQDFEYLTEIFYTEMALFHKSEVFCQRRVECSTLSVVTENS